MKIKKIRIPLYFGKLVLVQAKDISILNDKLGIKVSNKTNDAYMFAHNKKDGEIEYYMVFKKKTSNSIIAHEALHVVNAIFERVRITYDIVNDEPQAYLLGWIINKCDKFLK